MYLKDPYRSIAPLYDQVTASFLEAPRRRVVALCQERGWERVLDLGCGTGVLVHMLAQTGLFAVGVDASAAMLLQGKKHGVGGMGGAGVPRRVAGMEEASAPHRVDSSAFSGPLPFLGCPFIRGSGEALPFRSGSFSAAVCSLILHESDVVPDVLLAEALRVAPRVVVLEWRMPERNLDYLSTLWVHGIERLAGRAHYAHFRSFMRHGGVRGLAHRGGCVVAYEETLKASALTLVVLERPDAPQ